MRGIQAYSGTAARPTKQYNLRVGGEKYFGKDVEKIDMWKEMPQARKAVAYKPYLQNIQALKEAFPE